MRKIYELVGCLIHLYQTIEGELFLLYAHSSNFEEIDKFDDVTIKKFLDFDKSTLGKKLHTIKQLKIIESENDIDILEYINKQRNVLVHNFFLENIPEAEVKLLQMQNEAQLIERALRGLLKDLEQTK